MAEHPPSVRRALGVEGHNRGKLRPMALRPARPTKEAAHRAAGRLDLTYVVLQHRLPARTPPGVGANYSGT